MVFGEMVGVDVPMEPLLVEMQLVLTVPYWLRPSCRRDRARRGEGRGC